ncbi:CPBP family intramembrane glutamic endopeptidase [Hymenobacter weizhouensis]|uniref:CPBP family intramembrane glutamic endopeptidase n=1 Tax=Hymenobacter sp. YIM 151500-1 TaxID=2987689 RepID=UPI002225D5E4|nr:CPBP family intramembrane glutamic endopeptidase [Hymenobacter sp. YIM 151500-1]UYZ64446.1 CPBP family intramembrane metalloprotease [Hymenobacter sp. YIM 151500-1]
MRKSAPWALLSVARCPARPIKGLSRPLYYERNSVFTYLTSSAMLPYRPLGFAQSVLYFGVSALLFRLSVYLLLPFLLASGVAAFTSFLISYSVPLSAFILATVGLVAQEKNLPHWRARLRFSPLTGRQVLLCLGLFVLSFLLTGLLLPTARYLAAIPQLAPPDFLPDLLNPNAAAPGGAPTTFMGVTLKGAYWVIPVYFIFLTFFNILGEEIWFRGYLLPRQELVWGGRTWLYHGIFWCLFHTPIYPWTIVYLLPTTLAVSYAAQRFRNTWAGFLIHYAGNGVLALIPIILGVLR